MRRANGLLAVLAAVTAAGCGATPPQPPKARANQLNTATGGISTACGLSDQVLAFPGDHEPDLKTLEATAASNVRLLLSVYQRNPSWIFYGDTVRELVKDSITMLQSCGLGGASGPLVKAVSRRRRLG